MSTVTRAGVTPFSVVASCIEMAHISAYITFIHICSSQDTEDTEFVTYQLSVIRNILISCCFFINVISVFVA